MRVLMLTDLYPPFIGGIEQHVRNLSHGLVERGHEVTVATMSVDGQPASRTTKASVSSDCAARPNDWSRTRRRRAVPMRRRSQIRR